MIKEKLAEKVELNYNQDAFNGPIESFDFRGVTGYSSLTSGKATTKLEAEKRIAKSSNVKFKDLKNPKTYDKNCSNWRLAYGRIRTEPKVNKEADLLLATRPRQENENSFQYVLRKIKNNYTNSINTIKEYLKR